MRSKLMALILFLGIGSLIAAILLRGSETSAEAVLKNIDAMKAMEIANQWKQSKKEITSYVTPGEVVFNFPDKKVKRIPLPPDKMIVAVAPYITRTHK